MKQRAMGVALIVMVIGSLACVLTPVTEQPTLTVAPASPTLTATAVASPVETPWPSPIGTPQPVATDTPEPTATLQPTATAQPTATPEETIISPVMTPVSPIATPVILLPQAGAEIAGEEGDVLEQILQFNMAAVGVLLALIVMGERLVEAVQPVVKPWLTRLDTWLKTPAGWAGMVFSWLSLSALTFLSGVNIFGEAVPLLAGQVMTALLAGGGANLLHDLWPVK